MTPSWATTTGAREGATVTAYATDETKERVPMYVSLARQIAHLLEAKRTGDEDWFWLDADYEFLVERVEQKYIASVRVGHADSQPIVEVRSLIQRLVNDVQVPVSVRVNSAGEESCVFDNVVHYFATG